uniref:SMC hinge domain-containing protein n=1 Tax=Trichuris muris TaxID=70415 RepID=A0A5S6Q292_TRIMR
MTYRDDDGRITVFTRSVVGSSAEYRIDDEVVSHVRYVEALENINIFIRASNFNAFQGAVESVAMKTPRELTQLFEEISRSGELKDEYERAKGEMVRAEQNTQLNDQKKRGIAAERREAKMEKEEAEKYQNMRESLVPVQRPFVQLQLRRFCILKSKDTSICCSCIETTEKRSAKWRKSGVEEELREKRKHYGKALREINKLEQLINEQESETRVKQNFIKVKENVRHSVRKLKAFEKAYDNARRNVEKHREQLEQLEAQLQEVVTQREAHEAALLQEPQIRGMELSQQQIENPGSALGISQVCATIQQELTVLVREQHMDQELIDDDKRRQNEFTQKVKQKETELEALHRRLEKLNTNEIREQQQRLVTTEQDMSHAKDRLEQVTREVDDINRRLNEANMDSSENSRLIKKQELVENLKRVSTGVVYGRLVDLCQPVHRRYLLAVTKVLGNYMNSIITDTEKTARECIRYMKEQRIEPETFLPLDYIDVKSINERLSNFSSRTTKRSFSILIASILLNANDVTAAKLLSTIALL